MSAPTSASVSGPVPDGGAGAGSVSGLVGVWGGVSDRPCEHCGGGAIAHIKLTSCRGVVSATVSKTHTVTPVTRRGGCWVRHPCAIGGPAARRSATQGCWGPCASGRGRAPVVDALLTARRRLWRRRVQRQPQQPVADRAVACHVPVGRRGRQMRAEQGPRLVPDRCRHTPPPGAARGMCPVFGVPSECDAVKAARGALRAAEGVRRFRLHQATAKQRRSPAPRAPAGAHEEAPRR